MKVSLRLLSVMLSISLAISVISFTSPGQSTSAARTVEGDTIPGELSSDTDTPVNGIWAGENDITISAGSSNPAVNPEARPSEENAAEDGINTEPGGSISGHVYQTDGVTPVSGAEVYAAQTEAYFPDGKGVNSAPDGSYTISGLPPDKYELEVFASGYIEEFYDGVYDRRQATLITVADSSAVTGIDFTLDTGGSVSGHVYQADGMTPQAGANVYAILDAVYDYGNSTETGLDGSYMVSALPAGNYRVEVTSAGYLNQYYGNTEDFERAIPVAVTDQATTPGIDFILDAGSSISGYVYQLDGITTIANATVSAYGDSGGGETISYADGSYKIRALHPGNYKVKAAASGYIRTYYSGEYNYNYATPVYVSVSQDIPGIDFNLDPGGSISGHIYKSDGVTPVSVARIFVRLHDSSDYYVESNYSDSTGSYTIKALPPGNYTAGSWTSGYIYEYYNGTYNVNSASYIPVTGHNDTPGIDFILDTGGSISGHVYRADGETPIPGAHISATLTAGSFYYSVGADSSSDGSYTISGLLAGKYRLGANASSYVFEYYNGVGNASRATLVPVTLSSDIRDIEFDLDTGGSISGHVYQVDGVTPIPGALIYFSLVSNDDTYFEQQGSESDGNYGMNLLPAGNYKVWASAPGYFTEYYNNAEDYDQATLVTVKDSVVTRDINFTLSRGISVSGHVYQTDGITPISNARVWISSSKGGFNDTQYTASDGSYLFSGLPSRQYRLQVSADGFIDEYYNGTYDINHATYLEAGDSAAISGIDFTLDTGGSISGHIYQADGVTPISGAHISASLKGASYSYSRGADLPSAADGSYTVSPFPPGNYQVQVTADGYIHEYYDGVYDYSMATLVAVEDSLDTSGIDFTLNTGGSISGHVYQADGVTPVFNAFIYAEQPDVDFPSGRGVGSAPDGNYLISGLLPGNYRLRVYASGYIEEYYNGTYSDNKATLVPVTLDNIASNIDFTLDRGGSISGYVYQPDGITPIPDAQVNASLTGASYGYGNAATTSSDGSYTIITLPAGNYRVRAEASGYPFEYYGGTYNPEESTLVPVTLSNTTRDIDFTLNAGGSISGHVYQTDGVTPLSGASLLAELIGTPYDYARGSESEADGSYMVSGLAPGNYRLRVSAEGFVDEYYGGSYDYSQATPVLVTEANNTSHIDFVLDTGGSISGHVYQADGVTPVSEADVEASLTGSSYSYDKGIGSAYDGSYTISALPPGNYRVQVRADGYIREYYSGTYASNQATPVQVVDSTNTPDIDFTLDTGGSISGHIYRADGTTPISGVDVAAILTGGPLSYSRAARTAPDGSYTISQLPSGSYIVRANAADYLTEYYNGVYDSGQATLVAVADPADTPGIDFTLDTGGSISGHVYQADGTTPIASAEVYVSGNQQSVETITSEDGSYRVGGLYSESYRVRVTASGYIITYYNGAYNYSNATLVSVTAPNDTPGIDFALTTGGSISGHVYQADGVTPVPEADIYAFLTGEDYNYGQVATSDSDGSYLISGLLPGNYQLEIYASGYLDEYYNGAYSYNQATLVPVTLGNTTSNIDFTLETGGSISGHVYQSDGTTPVTDARVYASLQGEDYGYSRSAYSAADGSFTVSALLPGNYRLDASATGYIREYYNDTYISSQASLINVVDSSAITGIDFTLETGGSISGHVYQADGVAPISNANINASLTGAAYSYSRSATTSSDGSYTISQLPSGSYRVRAKAADYLTEYYNGVYDTGQATLVAVADPEDTPGIDFTLDMGGSISGHVYQADGTTPVAGAEVYVYGKKGFGHVTTAADGSYTIKTLYFDSYQVSVTAIGYVTTYYDGVFNSKLATLVNVTASQNTPDIDFALSTGGSVSGHIYQTDGVTPVPNASIRASLEEVYSYTQSVISALDGSYVIAGLPPGNYQLGVSASGYIDEYYNGTYDEARATLVPVTLSNITPDIDFTLDKGGSISGHIYQADGITPVPNAHIYARLQLNKYYYIYYYAGYSDSSGGYVIRELPSGNYTVEARASGYVTEYYGGTYDVYASTLVPVIDPDDTPDIDFELDTGGSISGHIYQADGVTPISGAYISISLIGSAYSSSAWTSAPDGGYLISTLMPGDYRLSVQAEGYIMEYYNGAYDVSQATLVTVADSALTSGIDITLDTGGSISGYVYQADGVTPIPDAQVYASSVDSQSGNAGKFGGKAKTGKDGRYTVQVLPSRMYKIRAQAEGYAVQYYKGAFDYYTATMVNVNAPHNTPGINFGLDKGGSISGHVYQADGVTPVSAAMVLISRIVNVYPEITKAQVIKVSQDGSYTVRDLSPGNYQVSIRAEGYITEYYGGVYQSSEATPVGVALSTETSDIDFSLEAGGTVSGHVYASDGVTPISGATVGTLLEEVDSVSTAGDGSYTIKGIPAGSYQVYAYKYGYLSEYYSGAFYLEQATPVKVTAPEATSDIDFTLDKGGSISGLVYQSDGVTPVNYGFRINAIPTVSGTRPRIPAAIPVSEPYILSNDYLIQDLPPGEYRVRISASGYVSEYYDGALSPEYAALVTVNPGTETPDIDFTLDAGGSISGRIYNSDGSTPIRGATVTATLTGATDDYTAETTTKKEGSYTLSGLASGSYKVKVSAEGYADEYYRDVYLPEEASPVSVTVPDNTPGIDFSLEKRGDANKDGDVNMGDVTRVEMIILGLAEDTPPADANGDGKINMGDVTRIELNILGF